MVLRTHIPDASPAIRPAIRPGVSRVMVLTFVLGILSGTAHAQDASWFDRVLTTKAEQPRWMTPLVTVTPRLEQEFRYDMLWRRDPDSTNFGFGKGLELIPAERLQVSVSVPPYLTHASVPTPNGFGDFSVLTKVRLWAVRG